MGGKAAVGLLQPAHAVGGQDAAGHALLIEPYLAHKADHLGVVAAGDGLGHIVERAAHENPLGVGHRGRNAVGGRKPVDATVGIGTRKNPEHRARGQHGYGVELVVGIDHRGRRATSGGGKPIEPVGAVEIAERGMAAGHSERGGCGVVFEPDEGLMLPVVVEEHPAGQDLLGCQPAVCGAAAKPDCQVGGQCGERADAAVVEHPQVAEDAGHVGRQHSWRVGAAVGGRGCAGNQDEGQGDGRAPSVQQPAEVAAAVGKEDCHAKQQQAVADVGQGDAGRVVSHG